MIGGFNAAVNLGDLTVRINDKRVPGGQFAPFVIHNRSVFGRHLSFGIGQQFEIEPFFCAKILMRLHRVHTHAEDDRARLLVLHEIALEIPRLHRATAREIFRIKIEHDPFATIIFQTDLAAIAGRQTKIRRWLPHLRLFLCLGCMHQCQCNKPGNR